MPSPDPAKIAARLIERIDAIIALVHSWEGRAVFGGRPTLRAIPPDGFTKFDDLDVDIARLAAVAGLQLLPSTAPKGDPSFSFDRGHTALRMMGPELAEFPDDWERRIAALKRTAQEAIDGAVELKTPRVIAAEGSALNWLQARFLESDPDRAVIPCERFHDYLLSINLPMQKTIDHCRDAAWIEDTRVTKPGAAAARSAGTFSSDMAKRVSSYLPLPSVPGYRILPAVLSAAATLTEDENHPPLDPKAARPTRQAGPKRKKRRKSISPQTAKLLECYDELADADGYADPAEVAKSYNKGRTVADRLDARAVRNAIYNRKRREDG